MALEIANITVAASMKRMPRGTRSVRAAGRRWSRLSVVTGIAARGGKEAPPSMAWPERAGAKWNGGFAIAVPGRYRRRRPARVLAARRLSRARCSLAFFALRLRQRLHLQFERPMTFFR